ncbi:MAG TPA: T9SS type A sorting domain-containing protein [Bacteroidia bacterium]|jgi:hypothetical protein|nr:T9SS type A sorting domain-containing protein [Bacteroidia bacterium]
MKKYYSFTVSLLLFAGALLAQTQIANGGFELWDNAGTSTAEPTYFNSNKTGSNTAQLGPQTCYQDASIVHSGSYAARMETKYYVLAVVNGSLTTGVVNAPSSNKSEGYIGTINYSSATDIRRMPFTGRPDSLVGWYQYTQATGGTGASSEQGKVIAILHVGNYYDPATPVNNNHPDSSINKIGDALYVTPMANVTTWTRFSVPFNYVNSNTPAYIMVSSTPSNNQNTTAPNSSSTGSKMWLDDISVIYNGAGVNQLNHAQSVKVFCSDKTVYVDFLNRSEDHSTLTIFDLTGKMVSSQKVDNNKLNSINVSGLNTGMYLYQLTGTAYQRSGKFIVE